MNEDADGLHFPGIAPIDAYGNGGFRFAGMSHRGSLLCLPDGIWAWPVTSPQDITSTALKAIFARADHLDTVLIGTGVNHWRVPDLMRARFREMNIACDVMQTGPAIRIYNIMAEERRRVAAALIAVP
jgi:uncharacterized protein